MKLKPLDKEVNVRGYPVGVTMQIDESTGNIVRVRCTDGSEAHVKALEAVDRELQGGRTLLQMQIRMADNLQLLAGLRAVEAPHQHARDRELAA